MSTVAARRAARAVAVAVAGALVLAGCAAGPQTRREPPRDPRRPVIRVTSFDFAESQILAEVYARALETRGYPVQRIIGLGSREIVGPALEQGKADLVPEYLGTALDFYAGGGPRATADQDRTAAELHRELAGRGLVSLRSSPAQDQNGFAVTREAAIARNLHRISDLRAVAPGLAIGGPAECPERPLCLPGLQRRYGLRFREFRAMPSRSVTAEALEEGEIGVGMLETTSPHLRGGRLILLADDRALQPAENVVPVVRREVLDAYGPPLARLLDAVTARLVAGDLIELNGQVELEQRAPAAVAAAWLREALPG